MLLVVLLVTNCYFTCHARLLKGLVLSNEDNNNNSVVAATASGLNLALPTRLFEVSGGGSVDVEGHDNNDDKYVKFRALVLAALPKGTKRVSGPSKRHNDLKT